MMKKFIRDLGLFPHWRAARTAELPKTIRMKRSHSTANCSVCNTQTGDVFISFFSRRFKEAEGDFIGLLLRLKETGRQVGYGAGV